MGLKKNFLYSGILAAANYIFPLITFPYTSRVLGVVNIGICNFVDSIIQYFILFSFAMGSVAIREVAKYKNDRDGLNRVFNNLFWLNAISTIIVLIVLIISIFLIPKLYEYKELMFIGALKLVFNFLLIEWLYRGIEDFKFITLRMLFVRCIYVISVFLFVKEKEDYTIYYVLLVGTIILNAIINLHYAKNIVTFSVKNLKLKYYITPVFSVGLYNIITSMYTTFNITYLGFVKTEIDVGYYTTALKLYSIVLSLYTAFTGVLLPRMSSLLAEGKKEEFKTLINLSIRVLVFVAIPVVSIFILAAPIIVKILAGEDYNGAILPMRIIAPLIFIVGYELILVHQVLIPLKEDKIITRYSIIGAIIGIILNIVLVSTFASVGSSISWLISEMSILLLAQHYVSKRLNISLPCKDLLKTFVLYVPLILVLWYVSILNLYIIIKGVIIITISMLYVYSLYKLFYHDTFIKLQKK